MKYGRYVVVTGSEPRLQNMKAQTERLGGEKLFYFTTFERISPQSAFYEPIWWLAGAKNPIFPDPSGGLALQLISLSRLRMMSYPQWGRARAGWHWPIHTRKSRVSRRPSRHIYLMPYSGCETAARPRHHLLPLFAATLA